MSQQRSFVRLAVALASSLSFLGGCSSSDATTPAAPATLSAVLGADAQSGPVGQPLATAISVKVLSASGSPVAGTLVSWSVQSGGGSISVTSSSTDSLGVASVSWTLGTVAGIDALTATVGGLTPLTLSATANPGAAVSLVKVSGDAQVVGAGTAAQPLTVKAVDAYGNAVSGVTVTWVPENGGELSANATVTGPDGTTQIVFTVDAAITYHVMAALQSDASVQAVFTETGS